MATRDNTKNDGARDIAFNRKALHDYHVLEQHEAGIALLGTEMKSIREGSVNLRDSYARIDRGEIWLLNVHIGPYSHSGYSSHEERRQRKLLLHKNEIKKGMTLVPLRLYFKGSRVKVTIAVAKGKQVHDKRETIRRREVDRETRAAVKSGQRRKASAS